MLLLEIQKPTERFLWHMTEASNIESILKNGLVPTMHGVRGVKYKTPSLFFFNNLDRETLEEIETVVRFGGVDFEDEQAMEQRNDIPLALLEIDLQVVEQHDAQQQTKRVWHHEKINPWSDSLEWITSTPIPREAIRRLL